MSLNKQQIYSVKSQASGRKLGKWWTSKIRSGFVTGTVQAANSNKNIHASTEKKKSKAENYQLFCKRGFSRDIRKQKSINQLINITYPHGWYLLSHRSPMYPNSHWQPPSVILGLRYGAVASGSHVPWSRSHLHSTTFGWCKNVIFSCRIAKVMSWRFSALYNTIKTLTKWNNGSKNTNICIFTFLQYILVWH